MKYIALLISFLWVQSVFAQSKLPVIKATSKNVAINDGGYLDKNAWSLNPNIKLDVFTADRTRKTKWVTFYTDIDSIRVKVKPGTKYNFVVVLNGRDSFYTQIASAIHPASLLSNTIAKPDTIPFTLTAYNAIQVTSVINNTDTLNLHFDLTSFDFHLTKDAIVKKTKLLSNQPDALAGKTTPNYNNLNKVFKLQMGTIIWNTPEVIPTMVTAHDMDGRFGWNLFEGKQVEIDYDHHLLIIHSKLPKALKGYVRSKLGFTHSYAYIKGTFEVADKKFTGNFLMDIGSEQALILDSTWAGRQGFSKDLKVIKTSILHDPRGVKYETRTVLSPIFKLNGFELTNVPTLILGSKNPSGFEINYLGNDLFKRFNIILDFKNDYIYLKPNKLTGLKYRA
ncbi:hypothetical protein [Mucilaginibacter aquariorum]|uniref:Aspartyl protease n=1 Tax=Mucilaginibacter aquariorum TaxID=2967225 RepID=A0ABT1SWK6_9SPHI|nr:hypothetical protein [Mucilaginibacter aquariorum]MCQ6956632.1 hypothetical protein [Mucilaginibacter aquariorum]